MVDFHSHILPRVDDGSRSFNESTEMLREALAVGFDKVISTSHYATAVYESPEKERIDLFNKLKDISNIPELYLGSEIYITYNIAELVSESKASTINNTNYLLIEIPLRERYPKFRDTILELQDKGYKLILAHPERYKLVQENYEILDELADIGVLFQSNYGSILGIYGNSAKKTVKKMLKDGYVSLLGTDVHFPKSIYPKVPKAIKKISKYVDEDELYALTTENAERILNGETL